MVVHIKSPSGPATSQGSPADVPKIVKGVIGDIRTRGDQAVRVYSEKFDKWTPESFKLSTKEIEEIVAKVPKVIVDDIKTVQHNVRTFALEQRKTITDLETEIRPGTILGHKNIPIGSVGA
jgi:histidinol dehydrogenase